MSLNSGLQSALRSARLLWMTTFSDMEIFYDLITTNAAKAIGIKGHVLEPGGNVDLVVLDAEDIYHAIWEHEAPLRVIRKGKDVTLK